MPGIGDEEDLILINSFYNGVIGEWDISPLDKRLMLQKLAFIAKKVGFKPLERYLFNFYLHGPYSPDLAADVFFLKTNKIKTEEYEFSDPELNIIKNMKKFFSEEISKNDSYWFELYGAILFARFEEKNDEGIKQFIREKKSWYSEEEIEKGLEKMKEFLASFES